MGPIAVDGRLDEPAWGGGPAFDAFIQRDPTRASRPPSPPSCASLYDDDALYVGARLDDGEPDRIVRAPLAPRRRAPTPIASSLYLDPQHDHLTGVQLRVSAAGVQQRRGHLQRLLDRRSWDAVWISRRVSATSRAGRLEMRIPFSQLRFRRRRAQVWGVNASRYIQRKNERTGWRSCPKTRAASPRAWPTSTASTGVRSRARRWRCCPTRAGAARSWPGRAGDPFNDGSRLFGASGLDLRYGLDEQPDPRRHRQPGLRPGGGGPGGREPEPTSRPSTTRSGRSSSRGRRSSATSAANGANNYCGLHPHGAGPVLLAAHRPHARRARPESELRRRAPSATTILGAVKLTGQERRGAGPSARSRR